MNPLSHSRSLPLPISQPKKKKRKKIALSGLIFLRHGRCRSYTAVVQHAQSSIILYVPK